MTNKEVIALLQERGLKVESVSNTIPNIYADSFIEEFKVKAPANFDSDTKTTKKKTTKAVNFAKKADYQAEKKVTETKKTAAPKLPAGQFVKSAADVAKEKEEEKSNPSRFVKEDPKTPPATSDVKVAQKTLGMSAANGTKLAGLVQKQPLVQPKPASAALEPKAGPSQPKAVPVTPPKLFTEIKQKADGEIQVLHCKPPIVVREFATQIGMKPFKLISELMEKGIFASMNQTIDEEVAVKIAENHGFLLEIHHRGEMTPEPQKKEEKSKVDESKYLKPRPPVVCVLGHVDHGKTTLLDSIRKANVAAAEAGGITQHIGAYQVEHNKELITFIDTPGHAAFSKMRQRGADITDVAILVVAADDGFMPQTLEALKFAQNSNVPVVVAINKIDAPGANIDKVKQEMQQHNLAPEEWGGTTQCAAVSAVKGENIDALLELVLLESEMLEIKANPKGSAEGVVVESQIEVGRGATASVIIQKGTLKRGDAIVCGGEWCKVRAMIDDKGKQVKSAEPSTPVKIMGWSGAPEAGTTFEIVKNEKDARRLAEDRQHFAKTQAATDAATPSDLQNLFDAIASTKQLTFKVFVKGDVHGTVEAIKTCLEEIESDKIKLEIIKADVGSISRNDVIAAKAANAVIVAFNVKPETTVVGAAKHHNVRIIQHNIIYELIDQVKESMADMLEPELKEDKMGAAEVRQVFNISKGRTIAGSMVTEGRVGRSSFARLFRNRKPEPVYEGKVAMLKRFKEDATEVKASYECGIQLENFNDIQAGDIIECFEITKIKPTL